ncbi:MAG: chain-length determining protein [Prevotella sp.]|nr:chain-length determining protein [Prevotella sp.]
MNNNQDTIDLREIAAKLWCHKKGYVLSLTVAFVLACVWIIPEPRFYQSSVSLAPEAGLSETTGGTLGSLASSFGINLGNMQSSDAIYPMLYPDLLSSSDFIVSLFTIKVTTQDGKLTTDYYTYLTKHQKRSPWDYPRLWLMRAFNSVMPKQTPVIGVGRKQGKTGADPFRLSEKESGIVERLRRDIVCNVDRKTNVVSIMVKDQDPLISATMADSVRVRLQSFITQYRTNKAQQDVDYYDKLTRKAKADYERVRQTYGSYSDANTDVILSSFKLKEEDLENDMQLKFNAYTAFNTQLQGARANLQKRTPAFTVIQGASVPLRPAGPKRMIFVIGIMFLAFILTTCYFLREDLLQLFSKPKL